MNISFINTQSLTSITNQEFTFSSGLKEVVKVAFESINAKDLTTALKIYLKKLQCKNG